MYFKNSCYSLCCRVPAIDFQIDLDPWGIKCWNDRNRLEKLIKISIAKLDHFPLDFPGSIRKSIVATLLCVHCKMFLMNQSISWTNFLCGLLHFSLYSSCSFRIISVGSVFKRIIDIFVLILDFLMNKKSWISTRWYLSRYLLRGIKLSTKKVSIAK